MLLIDDIDLEISPDEVLSILKLYLDPLTKVFVGNIPKNRNLPKFLLRF